MMGNSPITVSRRLRYWLRRLHLWLGIILAVPLILLGLTGALLVFEDELDRLLRPEMRYVEQTGTQLSYAVLFAMAEEATGDAGILLLNTQRAPDETVEFFVTDGSRLYVDPYSGHVHGRQHRLDTIMGFFHAFHVSFLAGELGSTIGGLASLFAIISLISGLVLWWPRGTRKRYAFIVRLRGRWKQSNFDLHRACGFWLLGVLFVIAITGSMFTFAKQYDPLLRWITGSPPAVGRSFPAEVEPRPENGHIDADRAMVAARAAMPEAMVTRIVPPVENSHAWRIQMRLPDEPYVAGRTNVWVNPYSAAIVRVDDPRRQSAADRYWNINLHLHLGFWGGFFGEGWRLVTRMVWLFGSLAALVLAVTGIFIWWNPNRGQRRTSLNKP